MPCPGPTKNNLESDLVFQILQGGGVTFFAKMLVALVSFCQNSVTLLHTMEWKTKEEEFMIDCNKAKGYAVTSTGYESSSSSSSSSTGEGEGV